MMRFLNDKCLTCGFLLLVLAVSGSLKAEKNARLRPVALRCEYRVDPLGIDEAKPRLFWRVESNQRGQKQSAYRILVASTPELLAHNRGDLWDSGKVRSSRTIQIEYEGKPLVSRQQCYWKVACWDRNGTSCCWSKPARWTMGLLKDSDWSARYISFRDESPVYNKPDPLFLPPARQYRKEFTTTKKIKRATIYATALGIYELELNGKRVGDALFAPGWTDYRQRAYYNTYDVTELIDSGENAIGATLADGWYSGYVGFGLLTGMGTEKIGRYTYGKTPALMAQLEVEYVDGTRQTIGTDKTWKVTGEGPIRQADLLMGEFYDARMEMPGWSKAGFDDSSWQAAIFAEENGDQPATFYEFRNPEGAGGPTVKGRKVNLGFKHPKLESFPGNPVRITEEILPVGVNKISRGTYIFNLGQNFAGSVRLKLKGPAGHQVKLRFGEMLHPDGRLMTENLRKARATDYYVCKGDKNGETYTPRFTFHGFQYVEVSNLPTGEVPRLEDNKTKSGPMITGLVIHSDTPMTSSFACSDPMVNQLFSNVVWTQRANFLDLPTDCPQRDERMGWTGDAQAYIGTAAYNADVAAFFTKWNRELMESQRSSGAFPGYAPFPFQHGWDFGTAWADAGIICPWTIWQAYGDTRMIERCWKPMTKFMQWRKKTSRNNLGVNHGNAWGDWLTLGPPTPLDYIDTTYWAISTRMMAQMAQAIGHHDEAAAYRQQFDAIKKAFGKKYLKSDGSLTVHTQTAYALALVADLIPEQLKQQSGKKLAEMIAQSGNHMATGFLGTKPLLPVLSSVGQNDLATFLLQSHEFPSWGYEIDQGATSIWERWDGYTIEDGFGRHNASMNSYAHYSFGAVCEWMFRTLAGIGSDGPGYANIIIHPSPPSPGSNAQHEPIKWVKGSYVSIEGKIVSNWKVEGNDFYLEITIPANTTATVSIPAIKLESVTESGNPISQVKFVEPLRTEQGRVVLRVEAGEYHFKSTGAIMPAKSAFRTSKPVDLSVNPENIDLTDAKKLVSWNFVSKKEIESWTGRNNLEIENRNGKYFLVGTGDDPQLSTKLTKPLAGPLAIAIKARPAKGTSAQFFWAPPTGGFNATQQISRKLAATDEINLYLFKIGDDQPLQKLRFDPFSGKGEMEIESIAIYQLGTP